VIIPTRGTIGCDLCCQRVKPSLFGSIKGLPKDSEAACPKASQNPVCSWDTLWLGLPAKKSVSHAKLSPQFASGTRGSRRDAINPSKVGNTTVSALLSRDVPARLGLKALALAWPEVALAFSNPRPSQSRQTGFGPGLAWLRPWLLYGNILIYSKFHRLRHQHTSHSLLLIFNW
jgi:hypothetical protein